MPGRMSSDQLLPTIQFVDSMGGLSRKYPAILLRDYTHCQTSDINWQPVTGDFKAQALTLLSH